MRFRIPRLYTRLAEWWPLLSDPADYREEAEIFKRVLLPDPGPEPPTLLELGSGGGNNASHLKQHFRMTLVDASEGMLKVSRRLNPECLHLRGDMRTIELDREFDAVFIHDAIVYLTTREQLRQAVATAFRHCRPGGSALFVPDWTAESFRPGTSHGGHDRGDRGLRYIEWTIDPDPEDGIYSSFMVYLLREGDRVRRSAVDEHVCGLFPEAEWLRIIEDVGFRARALPFDHSECVGEHRRMFLAQKPAVRGAASPVGGAGT